MEKAAQNVAFVDAELSEPVQREHAENMAFKAQLDLEDLSPSNSAGSTERTVPLISTVGLSTNSGSFVGLNVPHGIYDSAAICDFSSR